MNLRHSVNRRESPHPSEIPSAIRRHVVAKYQRGIIAEHVGNEFIEALGAPLTAKQLQTTMASSPAYDDAERDEPASTRKLKLLRLNRIYIPLTQQHAIAQRLSEMIREGYVNRSPSTPESIRKLQENYDRRISEGIIESAPDVDAICDSYAIIGISGVGKSLLTRRVLAQFPKLIWHPTLRKYQIPYIVVECPHNGTIKQLILNFFAEFDRTAYTNLARSFHNRRLTVEQLIDEVNHYVLLYGVGLIVIDEIQHAAAANGGKAGQLFMNFLVRFVNESTAPVVIIGTMSSLEMLQSDFRQANRTLGALLTNYKPGPEWDTFLSGIWRYQWTKTVTPLSDELSKAMYQRSQGVPKLAVKLYQHAQRRAIETHTETLTVELVHQVADEEFTRVAPMIKALEENDRSKLAKYGDLAIPDFLLNRAHSPGGKAAVSDNIAATGLTMADLFSQAAGKSL